MKFVALSMLIAAAAAAGDDICTDQKAATGYKDLTDSVKAATETNTKCREACEKVVTDDANSKLKDYCCQVLDTKKDGSSTKACTMYEITAQKEADWKTLLKKDARSSV